MRYSPMLLAGLVAGVLLSVGCEDTRQSPFQPSLVVLRPQRLPAATLVPNPSDIRVPVGTDARELSPGTELDRVR